MDKQITLEEVLSLVRFKYDDTHGWQICDVSGRVHGDVLQIDGNVFNGVGGHVYGSVGGNVGGNVYGSVCGSVGGHVYGSVGGTINGRSWEFIETPKEKFQRLLQGTRNQELIDTFNQLEDNS
jgi:hypothetical protein